MSLQKQRQKEIEDLDAAELLHKYNEVMSSDKSGVVTRHRVWNEMIQRLKFYDREKKPLIIVPTPRIQ